MSLLGSARSLVLPHKRLWNHAVQDADLSLYYAIQIPKPTYSQRSENDAGYSEVQGSSQPIPEDKASAQKLAASCTKSRSSAIAGDEDEDDSATLHLPEELANKQNPDIEPVNKRSPYGRSQRFIGVTPNSYWTSTTYILALHKQALKDARPRPTAPKYGAGVWHFAMAEPNKMMKPQKYGSKAHLACA